MPYISAEERPALDARVEALADEVCESLVMGENKETEVSLRYRTAFVAVGDGLLRLERGEKSGTKGRANDLVLEVYGERGDWAWLGRFNYALTRLIQEVPRRMVERGVWKEEFRYWLYALTVGALTRAAAQIHASEGGGWPVDGVVGVLVDVKDEYKRRVNTAYEAVQIAKAGDCYTTPYRTELSEVRDRAGKVVGYEEVMRDLRLRR